MAGERSVGELLDELFGFESVAKRQTALGSTIAGELVRKALSASCWACLGASRLPSTLRATLPCGLLIRTCAVLRVADLARASKQAGVVGPLQMERRYAAFFCAWRTRLSC